EVRAGAHKGGHRGRRGRDHRGGPPLPARSPLRRPASPDHSAIHGTYGVSREDSIRRGPKPASLADSLEIVRSVDIGRDLRIGTLERSRRTPYHPRERLLQL